MTFRDLYQFRQEELGEYVKRTEIVNAVEKVSGTQLFVFMTGKISAELVRGFYICPGNSDKLPEYARGRACIGVARDNNRCWQRLVIMKECMHVFDSGLALTNTPEDCEDLLGEFVVSEPGDRSEQMIAEIRALWMGLSMICRESERAVYSRKITNGELTRMQVAEKLRMPVQYVPYLFGDRYKNIIGKFLESC